MFHNTSAVKQKRAEKKILPMVASYWESMDSWYDGTMDSVNERTARCSEVLRTVESELLTTGGFVQEAEQLKRDEQELVAFQNELLVKLNKQSQINYQSASNRKALRGLPKVGQKWVILESRKFIGQNQDVLSDRSELMSRAAQYVADNTYQLPSDRLSRLTAAFQCKIDNDVKHIERDVQLLGSQ